ncbi:MAG: T9SS type A sorting domain-containing protein, partial [Bacteroidetes bacterium]|nr:T9SS type A sorting domain-containing protein [Bacteroidota bacterium]
HIVDIDRNQHKIKLDVPIFDHFDREFVQTEIYKVALPGNVTEVGIEKLRVDIETNGVFDEAHAKSALAFYGAENVWVKQFTGLHFYYAAVDFTRTNFATVIQSKGLEPHSLIDGERRYNFNVGAFTSNILFTQCQTTEGRHSYVSNGASTASGIVFHRSTSMGDHNSSEGHRRWSQGLLYDNIAFSKVNNQILIGLYNRGSYGTAHGWSTTSGVAWNITSDQPNYNQAVIQKPPFHQNFAIGGNITLTGKHRFNQPPGFMEHAFRQVTPVSLYDTQLAIRLSGRETPDAPAQWKVSREVSKGIISMEWLDIAMDETGYLIEYSIDGGKSYQVLKNLPSNTTQYTFSDAGFNANTLFRLVAKGEKGWSPYTYSTTALVTTGTSNTLAQMGISLYPNPSGDILKISSSTPLKNGVIYHLNGTKLKEYQWENGMEISISLIELPQGQYFISLSSDDQKTAVGSFQKY